MSLPKNSTKPRILVLTPRYPYPVVGGDRLRIYRLCKELAKDYSLTLLSLCDTVGEMEASSPSDGVFDRIEKVYLPKWRSALNTLLALPTSTPLQVAYYRSREFKQRLGELLPGHKACVAHLIRTGDYLRGSTNALRVLEMTDAISMNYQRVRGLGKKRGLKTWVYRIEAKRLLTYEKKVIHEFEIVTLVSDTDREFLLQGRPSESVLVCSNGVDLTDFPFYERVSAKPIIAYIGNMTSVQNMDACLHFIEDLLPVISERFDVTFRIVGKINETDAVRLRRFQNVEVTGSVPNVVDAVAEARIGVCPVRIGAGVQNKVLEYMALGLPVITSSIGLEGLSAKVGEDILVADTAEEYISHIVRLWDEPNYGVAIARNGRLYVERHHEWSARLSPLLGKLKDVIDTQDLPCEEVVSVANA